MERRADKVTWRVNHRANTAC